MSTLKVTKTKALKAFGEAKNTKELMEKIFGKNIFPPVKKPVEQRIKTYEDACKEVGVHPLKSLPYQKPKTDNEKSINAYAKLRIIALALNEGWKPDWENGKYDKWMPYFNMPKNSGAGFSVIDYDGWYSFSFVSSRLCYKSEALCKYAATQFLDIYKEYMTL